MGGGRKNYVFEHSLVLFEPYFLSILIQNGKKKTVGQSLWGRKPGAPPPPPRYIRPSMHVCELNVATET